MNHIDAELSNGYQMRVTFIDDKYSPLGLQLETSSDLMQPMVALIIHEAHDKLGLTCQDLPAMRQRGILHFHPDYNLSVTQSDLREFARQLVQHVQHVIRENPMLPVRDSVKMFTWLSGHFRECASEGEYLAQDMSRPRPALAAAFAVHEQSTPQESLIDIVHEALSEIRISVDSRNRYAIILARKLMESMPDGLNLLEEPACRIGRIYNIISDTLIDYFEQMQSSLAERQMEYQIGQIASRIHRDMVEGRGPLFG